LTYISVWQRKYSEAFYFLQKREKALKASQTNIQPDLANGFIYLKNGYSNEANIEFNKAADYYLKHVEYNTKSAQGYYAHAYLACIYSALNEKEKAIEYLKMLKKRKTDSRFWLLALKEYPMFDNIRNEPEFVDVLKDVEAKYQKEHDRVGKLLRELGEIE
jgi:tetratricopeptide (TPR) repeat protein